MVTALLLAVAMGIPTSFTYDELAAANQRYLNETSGYFYKFQSLGGYGKFDIFQDTKAYSNRLTTANSQAIAALSVSLLITIISYWTVLNLGLGEEDQISREYWRFLRIIALLQVSFEALGVFLTYAALCLAVELKFPDRRYEMDTGFSAKLLGGFTFDANSPHQYFWTMSNLVLFGTLACGCVLSSLGIMVHFRTLRLSQKGRTGC